MAVEVLQTMEVVAWHENGQGRGEKGVTEDAF